MNLTSTIVLATINLGIIANELHSQSIALEQVAMKAASVTPQPPPQVNAECHETLQLFDEWLTHDLKSEGSGRKLQ